jgi:phosphatidylglycerol:prolipoprotein diacylglycerol transferase
MRPVLFVWQGVRIYSYPAMMYLGMVLGIVAGNYAANLRGLDSARVLVAMLLLTIPGLIGARLLFVAIHWGLYRREPRRIWRRSEGGAALQGGLVLAVAVSVPLLGAIGVPFAAYWDVATFTLLIWLIFARVGCLLHGCCSGRPSQAWFALNLPDHRGIWRQRIPTQILEAGWAALLLLGAAGLSNQPLFPGAVFLAALGAYALGRFALQRTREVQDQLGALNVQQAISAAFGVVALVGLLVVWLGTS